MSTLTYYAKLEKVDRGYKATVPVSTIEGIEEVVGNGRTPTECSEHTKSALTAYINLQKERGKPFPDPMYIAGALPLEIKIMKSALVVQRHDWSGKVLQELLSGLDYESIPSDNLEDAIRYLGQRRFDAVVTGSMYKKAPGEEVDDTAWEKLHKEVQRRQPGLTFILFTGMLDIDPSGYGNLTVHYISKIICPNIENSFRQLLK